VLVDVIACKSLVMAKLAYELFAVAEGCTESLGFASKPRGRYHRVWLVSPELAPVVRSSAVSELLNGLFSIESAEYKV
jgi:hypothetical protein